MSKNEKKISLKTKIGCVVTVGMAVNIFFSPLTRAQQKVENITIDRQSFPDPITVAGVSGGSLTATEVVSMEETTTGYCDGFVKDKPNHTLTLNSFFDFLKLEVESEADTTIMIKGPGGIWCNDDSNNTNPVIEGQWQPGTYKIWIGSYQEDAADRYLIRITSIKAKP